jgi:hypothetical protein
MKNIYYLLLLLLPDLCSSQVIYDDFESPSGIRYEGTGLFCDTVNPLSKGLNISSRVAKYVKKANSKDFINVKLNRKIADLTPYVKSAKKMSVFFYSYMPGMEVRITFLDSTKVKRKKPDSGIHSEFRGFTHRNNQWEVVYFDFVTSPDPEVSPTKINKMIIAVDPLKTASSVYYFDDLYGPEFITGETSQSH